MEKTRLGISVGLLGAILCFATGFGGITPAVIIAGYILLREDNAWLKTLAVRALTFLLIYNVGIVIVDLLPDVLNALATLVNGFGGTFSYRPVSGIFNTIIDIMGIAKNLLFIALGIKALSNSTVKLPVSDGIVSKNL